MESLHVWKKVFIFTVTQLCWGIGNINVCKNKTLLLKMKSKKNSFHIFLLSYISLWKNLPIYHIDATPLSLRSDCRALESKFWKYTYVYRVITPKPIPSNNMNILIHSTKKRMRYFRRMQFSIKIIFKNVITLNCLILVQKHIRIYFIRRGYPFAVTFF